MSHLSVQLKSSFEQLAHKDSELQEQMRMYSVLQEEVTQASSTKSELSSLLKSTDSTKAELEKKIQRLVHEKEDAQVSEAVEETSKAMLLLQVKHDSERRLQREAAAQLERQVNMLMKELNEKGSQDSIRETLLSDTNKKVEQLSTDLKQEREAKKELEVEVRRQTE